MAVFIRTRLPEYGNPFYNTTWAGGVSSCILGNSGHSTGCGRFAGLNVLPNCVGMATGAFNETYHKTLYPGNKPKFYFHINGNAKTALSTASGISALKKYVVYDRKARPTLGSIMSWGTTRYGHVAYVYKIIDNNTVGTIESNYFSAPAVTIRTRSRHPNGTWTTSGGMTYLGHVRNPAVDPDLTNMGDVPDSSEEAYVISITEKGNSLDDSGKIHVEIFAGGFSVQGNVKITMYYTFGSTKAEVESLKLDNAQYSVNCSVKEGATHTFILDDEPSYKYIGIILKQEYTQKSGKAVVKERPLFIKELEVPEFIPGGSIIGPNGPQIAVPYIFVNGIWRRAQPRIYLDGKWQYTGTLNEPK